MRTDPVATTFLDSISTFFTWVLARIEDLISFILGNELLTYMVGIILISFCIGVLVRLIRNRA